jgi:hypothetical protein
VRPDASLAASDGRAGVADLARRSTFDATVWWANSIVPGPRGTATYLSFGIVLVAAVVLVLVTRGRLSYQPRPVVRPAEVAQRAATATGPAPSPNRTVKG